MKRTNTTIILSSLLLAGLTACTSKPVDDRYQSDNAPVVKTEAATEEPSEEPTNEGPIPLTGTVTYDSGNEISLSGFTRAVYEELDETTTPYIRITVTVKNGGKEHFDLTGFTYACQYGDTEGQVGEDVYDGANGVLGAPSSTLLPGRKVSFKIGCELPKNESYLQVEINPEWTAETAIFAGKVQK